MATVTTTFIPNPAGLTAFFSPTGDLGIWMQGLVEQVEQVARNNCPKDTGALAASIEGKVIAGSNMTSKGVSTVAMGEVSAGDDSAPYALYVHEGTRRHEILPMRSPVLVFPSRSSGMTVFTNQVDHPGTKANPFLWDALKMSVV